MFNLTIDMAIVQALAMYFILSKLFRSLEKSNLKTPLVLLRVRALEDLCRSPLRGN